MQNKSVSIPLAAWIIAGLSIVLIAFTSYRTVDLMGSSLPAGYWWIGLFAVGAIDVGVLAWVFYLLFGAESPEQEGLAWLMIGICLIGVLASLLGDTLNNIFNPNHAKITEGWVIAAIIIQSSVIFANVVAGVVALAIDPKAKTRRMYRRIDHKMETTKLRAIEARADYWAEEAAEIDGEDWLDQEQAKAARKAARTRRPVQQIAAPYATRETTITAAADSGTDEGVTQVFTKGRGSQN